MRHLLLSLWFLGFKAPFRVYTFLRNLPNFWLKREYNRALVQYSEWLVRKAVDSVTAKELVYSGYVYAPYIPLQVDEPDWDYINNFRSWAKREIARMKHEMKEQQCQK